MTRAAIVVTWLGLAIVASVVGEARAQRLDELFEQGNRAFVAGDVEGAVRAYETLVAAGVDDPDVSFNLGVAHGTAGRHGHAIRWFERTLRLRPDDEAARAAAAATRRWLAERRAERDGRAEMEPEAGPGWFLTLSAALPDDVVAWSVLVADVLLFGLLALRRLSRSDTIRLAAAVGVVPVLLVGLFAASMLVERADGKRRGGEVIVLEEGVPMRLLPDERASPNARAAEGERCTLLDRHESWVQLRCAERGGWVPAERVGEI
ncbi:MAG: tetratricopeptide repeat protein [Myxococcota bacterium]|nr:tetratricopeptide repeat protein [Myxococcota bacterium]MDW8363590.1 tetratricopeptide repeat protein [Myxococcales bacterium]